ncbi:MAG TPA: PA0069 family radical SAM protein [Steroidobacteraceae bacterium]|nr:PA0069 family radical SAM protein [Steroidobacteraceae bacterium]
MSQPPGRFDKLTQTLEHDGWYEDEPPNKRETIVLPEPARSVISRNQSPDIHFSRSINPYRGCEHGCVYCAAGDTAILMANGRTKPLEELKVGDAIYGTERVGRYRRYVKTKVLAHWSVIKPAYRVTLLDGTTLVTGADHRFLSERGWKFVTDATPGSARRAHLTVNTKLMGVGRFATAPDREIDFRQGYLSAVIRANGSIESYAGAPSRGSAWPHELRPLAPPDDEALERTRHYLGTYQAQLRRLDAAAVGVTRRASAVVAEVHEIIRWPQAPSLEWHKGFLAGIFDADGSYRHGILRISNTDREVTGWIQRSLRVLNFRFVIEHNDVVRIIGGLAEHLRFFHGVDPAISRKRDIAGQAVRSAGRLAVAKIEPLGKAMRLFDITTGTEDFIANGVVSHNCYARPSHAYVGLSPGLDFETRLFYKADAARLLEKELAAPGYKCAPIMLGANTDPYQPIEKSFKVTRSLLEVLLRHKHPVCITTKGALVARDVDLLAEFAREGLTRVMFSIPTLDNDMKRVLEPRAAAAGARLKAMRVLADAGVPVGVLVAPIIPVLTEHEIEAVLEACREAGASAAGYTMLRLPWEVKDLFREWLAEHFPDRAAHVMSIVRSMRGERDNDPAFGTRMHADGPVAQMIRQRFQLACRRLGFPSDRQISLPTNLFRPPLRTHPQLSLDLAP